MQHKLAFLLVLALSAVAFAESVTTQLTAQPLHTVLARGKIEANDGVAALLLASTILFGIASAVTLAAWFIWAMFWDYTPNPATDENTDGDDALTVFWKAEMSGRRVLTACGGLFFGVLFVTCLLTYYQVGFMLRAGDAVRLNWLFTAGIALAIVFIAYIHSEFFRFHSTWKTVGLAMMWALVFTIFTGFQLTQFGYKRSLGFTMALLVQVASVATVIFCSHRSRSIMHMSISFVALAFMAGGFLLWDLGWFLGWPNEPSDRATLDSTLSTFLLFFFGLICFIISGVWAVVFYRPSPTKYGLTDKDIDESLVNPRRDIAETLLKPSRPNSFA